MKAKKKLTIEEEKRFRQQMQYVMLIGITLDTIIQMYPELMDAMGTNIAAIDDEGNVTAKGITVGGDSFKGNSAVESMMLAKLAGEKMMDVRNAIITELKKYDFDFGIAEQESSDLFRRIKKLYRNRHITPPSTDLKQ